MTSGTAASSPSRGRHGPPPTADKRGASSSTAQVIASKSEADPSARPDGLNRDDKTTAVSSARMKPRHSKQLATDFFGRCQLRAFLIPPVLPNNFLQPRSHP